jgi:hypothetical protein
MLTKLTNGEAFSFAPELPPPAAYMIRELLVRPESDVITGHIREMDADPESALVALWHCAIWRDMARHARESLCEAPAPPATPPLPKKPSKKARAKANARARAASSTPRPESPAPVVAAPTTTPDIVDDVVDAMTTTPDVDAMTTTPAPRVYKCWWTGSYFTRTYDAIAGRAAMERRWEEALAECESDADD